MGEIYGLALCGSEKQCVKIHICVWVYVHLKVAYM
jgi:hypothetical protein